MMKNEAIKLPAIDTKNEASKTTIEKPLTSEAIDTKNDEAAEPRRRSFLDTISEILQRGGMHDGL
jgi:hypothetical protein